ETTETTDTGEPLCDGAVDVPQWDGTPSGFVECPNGAILREAAIECSIEPASDAPCPANMGSCTVDADCKEMDDGQCIVDPFFGECACTYPICHSDADCKPGTVCDCGVTGPVPSCIPADCVTNDDCDGYGCRLYDAMPDCYQMTVSCHGPDDLCYADSECGPGESCTKEADIFACSPGFCAIGRPFLVDGEARQASAAGRDDWCARCSTPRTDHLDAAGRGALASSWTDIARMEHASIAAFARFGLQLLALGAPSSLVKETCDAMADETRHARLGYALASAYAGRSVGPGPLAIDAALGRVRLSEVVALVILEGCVGETVAAIEAAELAEHVREPATLEVLRGVAVDERRHAALAWRFLQWALERGGDDVAEVVAKTFAQVAREAERSAATPSARDRWALRQGVVTPAMRAMIRARAIGEVVLPCLAAARAAA
ncbi:MAG: ferritin-like domain-containing protein, partial [Myxococcales bacterium]|nr:ferritin-like domain-containing protein [Myxococcales bacterium]